MSGFGLTLYNQLHKGITSISATQHLNYIPWVDRWKLGHFHPLPWMVCDIPCSATISIDVETTLNSQLINGFMDEIDTPLHRQTDKGITFILVIYHSKDVTWVHGWKLGHFNPLPWMICDVPWAPTIHTSVDTPFNPSVCTWVRLIHHCTSNKARGSHPYWPHNTPRMDQHGWKKTGTLSSSALDSVWCNMSSNHPCRCWNPS